MALGDTVQTSFPQERRSGIIGGRVFVGGVFESDTVTNEDPQAVQVDTVEIDTATATETYSILISSPVETEVSFVSSSGSTTTAAEELATAWNQNPTAGSVARATSVGAVVTLTGNYPNVVIVLAEGQNAGKMTLTSVSSAAPADAVPAGRAMISTAFSETGGRRSGIVAKSTSLTAQVDTIVILYAAGEKYLIGVTVDGQRYSVAVDADTNTATTVTAIVTALNLNLPADSVLVTESGGTDVILTSELAGRSFLTDVGTEIDAPTNAALTNTTSGVATDFDRAFIGISMFKPNNNGTDLDISTSDYRPNRSVQVAQQGDLFVESTETVPYRGPVFVELAPGATEGRMFAAASATRVLSSSAALLWERSLSGGTAHVKIHQTPS